MTKGISVHLVSSSHWDREWYLTVEQYRFRLVECMDRALGFLESDPAWKFYMTDGQTQMVLDYLEVRPEQRETVRRFARAGRLRLGPWRVQPDLQIIGAEALVRNLLTGHRDCEALGGIERHGYLADNFGHVGQMPQVLRGFGIGSACFWRGYDENQVEALENNWVAPDGSAILAVLLPRGYTSAAGYGPGEKDNLSFEKHWLKLRELSRTGVIVMNDGTDHALPTPNLDAVLAFARERLTEAGEIRHSHWGAVIEEIELRIERDKIALPTLDGELLFAPGLDSTFSSHLDQKQANMRCEAILSRCAEPLAALAAACKGKRYPKGFFDRAWEMMVKNAAHDSIAGCHGDKVARDVIHRYDRAAEIAEGLIAQGLDDLAGKKAQEYDVDVASSVALFNPSATPRHGVVEVELSIPDTKGRNDFGWLFADMGFHYQGRRLESHILEDRPDARPTYRDRGNPVVRNTRTFRALVNVPAIPALGALAIDFDSTGAKKQDAIFNADGVEEGKAEIATVAPALLAGPNVLRNEFVELTMHPDGTFDLADLESGRVWKGLNLLVDEQCRGNLYSFNPSRNGRASVCAPGGMETLCDSRLRGSLRVATTIACFDQRGEADLIQRCAGNNSPTAACPIFIDVSLHKGSRRVDIAVTLDNRAGGHRLRARFPILTPGSRVRVNSVFDLVDRSAAELKRRTRGITFEQLRERPAAGMIGFQTVEDGEGGLLLAGRGLYEYRHQHERGVVELTLLRSSGAINFGFEAWGSGESGYMIGTHRMEYAIEPFRGELFASGALESVDAFLNPVVARQFPAGTACAAGGPALEDARLAFSALKGMDNGAPGFIFRFFNRSADTVRANIPLGRIWRRIERRRLDETGGDIVGENTNRIAIEVRPKEIVTLALLAARE